MWDELAAISRETHGSGWCKEGHGPFLFDEARINSALKEPSSSLTIEAWEPRVLDP